MARCIALIEGITVNLITHFALTLTSSETPLSRFWYIYGSLDGRNDTENPPKQHDVLLCFFERFAFPNERQTNVNFVPQFPRYVGHVPYPAREHYRFCFPRTDEKLIARLPHRVTWETRIFSSFSASFFGFLALSYFWSSPFVFPLFDAIQDKSYQTIFRGQANEQKIYQDIQDRSSYSEDPPFRRTKRVKKMRRR